MYLTDTYNFHLRHFSLSQDNIQWDTPKMYLAPLSNVDLKIYWSSWKLYMVINVKGHER
jgi:hypothetical protein